MSSISSPRARAFSRTIVVKQSSISSSASVSMRSSFSSSSFFANREELMMPFVFFEKAISSLVIIAASSASISSSFIAALNSLTLLLKTSNCFAETACKLAIVSANFLPSSSATSILFANSAATSPNVTLVASALRIIGDNSRLVNLTLVPSLDTSREYLRWFSSKRSKTAPTTTAKYNGKSIKADPELEATEAFSFSARALCSTYTCLAFIATAVERKNTSPPSINAANFCSFSLDDDREEDDDVEDEAFFLPFPKPVANLALCRSEVRCPTRSRSCAKSSSSSKE